MDGAGRASPIEGWTTSATSTDTLSATAILQAPTAEGGEGSKASELKEVVHVKQAVESGILPVAPEEAAIEVSSVIAKGCERLGQVSSPGLDVSNVIENENLPESGSMTSAFTLGSGQKRCVEEGVDAIGNGDRHSGGHEATCIVRAEDEEGKKRRQASLLNSALHIAHRVDAVASSGIISLDGGEKNLAVSAYSVAGHEEDALTGRSDRQHRERAERDIQRAKEQEEVMMREHLRVCELEQAQERERKRELEEAVGSMVWPHGGGGHMAFRAEYVKLVKADKVSRTRPEILDYSDYAAPFNTSYRYSLSPPPLIPYPRTRWGGPFSEVRRAAEEGACGPRLMTEEHTETRRARQEAHVRTKSAHRATARSLTPTGLRPLTAGTVGAQHHEEDIVMSSYQRPQLRVPPRPRSTMGTFPRPTTVDTAMQTWQDAARDGEHNLAKDKGSPQSTMQPNGFLEADLAQRPQIQPRPSSSVSWLSPTRIRAVPAQRARTDPYQRSAVTSTSPRLSRPDSSSNAGDGSVIMEVVVNVRSNSPGADSQKGTLDAALQGRDSADSHVSFRDRVGDAEWGEGEGTGDLPEKRSDVQFLPSHSDSKLADDTACIILTLNGPRTLEFIATHQTPAADGTSGQHVLEGLNALCRQLVLGCARAAQVDAECFRMDTRDLSGKLRADAPGEVTDLQEWSRAAALTLARTPSALHSLKSLDTLDSLPAPVLLPLLVLREVERDPGPPGRAFDGFPYTLPERGTRRSHEHYANGVSPSRRALDIVLDLMWQVEVKSSGLRSRAPTDLITSIRLCHSGGRGRTGDAVGASGGRGGRRQAAWRLGFAERDLFETNVVARDIRHVKNHANRASRQERIKAFSKYESAGGRSWGRPLTGVAETRLAKTNVMESAVSIPLFKTWKGGHSMPARIQGHNFGRKMVSLDNSTHKAAEERSVEGGSGKGAWNGLELARQRRWLSHCVSVQSCSQHMHANLQAEMRVHTALSRGQSPMQRVALHAHAINMQIDAGVRSLAQDGDNKQPLTLRRMGLSHQVPHRYIVILPIVVPCCERPVDENPFYSGEHQLGTISLPYDATATGPEGSDSCAVLGSP